MSLSAIPAFAEPSPDVIPVRAITVDDIRLALRAGVADFMAMPTHVIFLVLIYPVIGILIARLAVDGDLLPLAYPMAAGFAILGPVAALGMYQLSRSRERGQTPTWRNAFDALRSPGAPAIAALAVALLVLFIAWIATAQILFAALGGDPPPRSIGALLHFALGTPSGWLLVVLGNGLGFAFAALAFTVSVVSLPLLLDRGGTAIAAVRVSVRAVRASPGPMALWGLIVATALFAGSLPFFVGLALVLPVLGHATWHLYRSAVPATGGAEALRRRRV